MKVARLRETAAGRKDCRIDRVETAAPARAVWLLSLFLQRISSQLVNDDDVSGCDLP
jgi:hypothetical protein